MHIYPINASSSIHHCRSFRDRSSLSALQELEQGEAEYDDMIIRGQMGSTHFVWETLLRSAQLPTD